MNLISSVLCATAKDDGICCLFRGDWLLTAFHSALELGLGAWNKVQPSSLNIPADLQNGEVFNYCIIQGIESGFRQD